MTPTEKKKWICPECSIKKPKSDNTNTPVRGPLQTEVEDVLVVDEPTNNVSAGPRRRRRRDRSQARNSNSDNERSSEPPKQIPTCGTCKCGQSLSSTIAIEVRSALRAELPVILSETLETKLAPIKEQLSEMQTFANFISAEYDELKRDMSVLITDNRQLQSESNKLRTTVNALTDRLNQMEQVMRESNIEIQGVPEHKAENVISIVKQLANVVSYKLSDADILHCTRVASMNKQSKRPRTIVAKLRSTRCRDELYSSVSKYNKANAKDKLNSSLLGIAGEKTSVYVSEHLSPINKALHAAARIKAKEMGYMFVWVRNGRIFMRKNETSRFIHVRNEGTLSELD